MGEPILVVIFLRGGADSLSLIAPTADADYIAARPEALRVLRGGDRPGLALPPALADVEFRLHPAAAELHELFGAGDLSLLHATGLTEATRSHFDAEARIERGGAGGTAGGWLARWLAAEAPAGPLPVLAVGAAAPESLRGARAAVAPALADLMFLPGNGWAPALRARLQEGFGAHGPLTATLAEMVAMSDLLQGRLWDAGRGEARAYVPDLPYPEDSALTEPLMTVAQAIKQDLGLRVATVDYGGWDTHDAQAAQIEALIGGLSRALMAFWRDLGPRQNDVAVVVQSEFGRRLRANESGGTDHGRAGAMMVLGPQARGGRLLGRWPGLANEALEEGADLAVTTDYRDVLAEVMAGHMGFADTQALFPGLMPQPPGLYGRRA
ncbi:DUF1501 domain-containing protein [Rhodobacter sp. Har01]|uniref:DUF1501 domain-containing protein n=1 Tax=Rhodobacter sp. Har01 TaxID=2883999 RepID=UPI001D07B0CB|nr:DUF1501 domain-containing protein [Rhodobacter sp. Har01]MCB6177584.1 DUF1501 domain-containing protein [Rhodobacter sp. Har01]